MILLLGIFSQGLGQFITALMLLSAVAASLVMVMMGKRLAKKPEGSIFSINCPYCDESIEVELQLVPID